MDGLLGLSGISSSMVFLWQIDYKQLWFVWKEMH